MTINKHVEGTKLLVALGGKLDTMTAPELEKELDLEGIKELKFDFKELSYISSAGLRVLLKAQKNMEAQEGTLVIKRANEMVMEIFDVTGFVDILTIEEA